VALTFDEWEAPTIDEVDAPSNLEGVPKMVETMALIEDIVGVAPTKRLKIFGVWWRCYPNSRWSQGFSGIRT
jgi:hypothetical protein